MHPILTGDCPDPAIFREGDTFYLTFSSGPYDPGLPIYSSRDLEHWTLENYAVREFGGKEIWAPDFFRYKDRYYMYFSGAGTNWVTWTEDLRGAWAKPVDLEVHGLIDPGHVVDEEGKRYLLLSGGHIVPLSEEGLSAGGPVRKLLDPPPLPEELDYEGEFPEAPNIIRTRGYYYLSYADGGTSGPATSHRIMMARAKNLEGPWEFSPYNPLVATKSLDEPWICKGHGHFVEDEKGNLWVVFHGYENGYMNRGRKLLLSPVEVTADGWFQVPEEEEKGAWSQEIAVCDPRSWQRLRGSAWSDLSMEDGCMRWKGSEEAGRCSREGKDGRASCECGPALLNTGDHSYELSARVEVAGEMEAGLIAIYNEQIYNGVSVDGKALRVYRLGRLLYQQEFSAGTCWLKLRVRRHYLDFFVSRDKSSWQKIKVTIDLEPQNTNAYDGFLAVRPGVFAGGRGEAVVKELQYRRL